MKYTQTDKKLNSYVQAEDYQEYQQKLHRNWSSVMDE